MNRPKTAIATALALTLLFGGAAAYASGQDSKTTQAASSARQAVAKQRTGQDDKKEKHDGKLPIVREAAKLLSLNEDALLKELKAGKSLAELAQAKGISRNDLVAKLLEVRSKKIDEGVQAGKLTAEQAASFKAKMKEHVSALVDQKGLQEMLKKDARHHGKKHAPMFRPEKVAELLGMTKEELTAQLKQGKSLTEIAATKGISRDQLVAKLKEQSDQWINQMVDRKRPAPSPAPAG
ncbi:hypothetical protein J31TS4_30290 [Paenibacillus sp. J31TS4]|uniref:hypothetical protein n=1 Tax=Paenibacillus sp. J31TS4 TaxID=2807195 RepID=UPI001B2E1F35|nr:hypothetical protein [Paenibacillus sp. J31TS4]GIP39749.1 hypothetical protein J31TS4_30290 [Paenibacillus sp. J31TS4]